MSPADLLTRGTIWLSLACYAFTLWEMRAGLSNVGQARRARAFWTAGWALLVVHVACAFQFHHHWNHADAYADTAQKSQRLVGFAFGGGVYFNYLTLLLWGADVAWWWREPWMPIRRSAWIGWALHAYLAFMVLNATIVFERGAIRWVAVVVAICLVAAWQLSRNCRVPESPMSDVPSPRD